MLGVRKNLKLVVILLLLIGLIFITYDFSKEDVRPVTSFVDNGKNLSVVIPYSNKFKNLHSKYLPITGEQYKSYFLHYCFPGFLPIAESDCKREFIAGRDPGIVQVNFKYSLLGVDVNHTFLETYTSRVTYPFPVNVNLDGKTPYSEEYKRRAEYAKKETSHPLVKDIESKKYDGLNCYKSKGMVSGGLMCIPDEYSKYKTKIGNPPIFICSSPLCMIVLDQTNGWVVRATFHVDALNDWENFYTNLNRSIDTIMEK